MTAVPFDTLKLARDLEAAGLAAPVAAGASAALADALSGADLATKSDLAALEARLLGGIDARFASFEGRHEIRFSSLEGKFATLEGKFASLEGKFSSLEGKFDSKLELLRRDMTIRLGGMLVVGLGVLVTAMRLLPHP